MDTAEQLPARGLRDPCTPGAASLLKGPEPLFPPQCWGEGPPSIEVPMLHSGTCALDQQSWTRLGTRFRARADSPGAGLPCVCGWLGVSLGRKGFSFSRVENQRFREPAPWPCGRPGEHPPARA